MWRILHAVLVLVGDSSTKQNASLNRVSGCLLGKPGVQSISLKTCILATWFVVCTNESLEISSLELFGGIIAKA